MVCSVICYASLPIHVMNSYTKSSSHPTTIQFDGYTVNLFVSCSRDTTRDLNEAEVLQDRENTMVI